MRSCSLCCCVLPESSSKRRRLYGISSSFALQAFMDASVQAALESVVPPDKTKHLREDCVAQALAAPNWKGYEDVSSAEESNDSVPLLLAKRCVSHLERRFIECTLQLHSCIAVCRTIHAYGIISIPNVRACGQSCDTSHPIGSMQIPVEHTKTVQESPDPSFRVLVMQYIQRCANGRGLDARLWWLVKMNDTTTHLLRIYCLIIQYVLN